MTLPSTFITLPKAQAAAARLGCDEFAIVADERSASVTRVWVAEQTGPHEYHMRECLGEGNGVGKFSYLYLQACRYNMRVISLENHSPTGTYDIYDESGYQVLVRERPMKEAYTAGQVMSESAILGVCVDDVLWACAHDEDGKEVASTPVKVTRKVPTPQGGLIYTLSDDAGRNVTDLKIPAKIVNNPSSSQAAHGHVRIRYADLIPNEGNSE